MNPNLTSPTNPYLIVLIVMAGFAWVLALMLWVVHSQVVDYTTYDVATAAALTWWVEILVLTGVAALVGATVIVGIRHAIRTEFKREIPSD